MKFLAPEISMNSLQKSDSFESKSLSLFENCWTIWIYRYLVNSATALSDTNFDKIGVSLHPLLKSEFANISNNLYEREIQGSTYFKTV